VPYLEAGFTEVALLQIGAAQVLLDEVLISAMRNPKLFPHGDDYRRAGEDVRLAYLRWREEGWLEDPARYHVDPPLPEVQLRALPGTDFLMAYDDPVGVARELIAFCG